MGVIHLNAEAILVLSHRRPFEPFEIHLTNGEKHAIRHPEQVIVTRNRLIIGYPERDRVVITALLHVA